MYATYPRKRATVTASTAGTPEAKSRKYSRRLAKSSPYDLIVKGEQLRSILRYCRKAATAASMSRLFRGAGRAEMRRLFVGTLASHAADLLAHHPGIVPPKAQLA